MVVLTCRIVDNEVVIGRYKYDKRGMKMSFGNRAYIFREKGGEKPLKLGVKFVDSYIIKGSSKGFVTGFTEGFEIDENRVKHAFAEAQIKRFKAIIKNKEDLVQVLRNYLDIIIKFKNDLDA